MNRRALFAVATLVALIPLTTLLLNHLWKNRPTPAQHLSTELLDSNLLTSEWNASAQRALTYLTRGTQFQDKWQINQTPHPEFLNIYFLKENLSKLTVSEHPNVAPLLGNCGFVGAPQIIVCDTRFLASFLVEHKVVPQYSNVADQEKARTKYREYLLLWILGHEIGHIVNHDRPAHFAKGAFSRPVTASSITQAQESGADAFAIQQLKHSKKQLLAITDVLMGVLNDDIKRRAKGPLPYGVGIIYDYRSKEAIKYANQGTHPEYIIRCVRMMQMAPVDSALAYQINDLARRMKAVPPQAPNYNLTHR